MTDVSKAAAAMGRKGGSVRSEAKAAAARENGQLGGRPLKYCPKCADEGVEQLALVSGVCPGCGSTFQNAEGMSV
jgi:ribosomal protein L37AE/L43A